MDKIQSVLVRDNKKFMRELHKQQRTYVNDASHCCGVLKTLKIFKNITFLTDKMQNTWYNISDEKNEDFQRKSNIGSINNQNFVNIPYGKLRDKLIYLCKLYGIEFKLQEESYTSKASFFDGDEIPIYDKENQKEYIFSGKRIKRGLYQTSTGKLINADCNGALNILRKSKVVDLSVLYNRGELNTPKRIRVV